MVDWGLQRIKKRDVFKKMVSLSFVVHLTSNMLKAVAYDKIVYFEQEIID